MGTFVSEPTADELMANLSGILPDVVNVARSAGEILINLRHQIGESGFKNRKPDGSIVTPADEGSSAYITTRLNDITPGISVLSEENNVNPEAEKPYWIIDPLDGTKIYTEGGTGFAINIALIVHGNPVLGVVDCPALDAVYFTEGSQPSYKQEGQQEPVVIQTARHTHQQRLRIAFDGVHGTRQILDEKLEALSEKFDADFQLFVERPKPLNMMVAEGLVDLHVKTGQDSSLRGSGGYAWDNAADQLILENAGGGIGDLYNGYAGLKPYSKIGRNRMHGYIAFGDRNYRDSLFPSYPR